LYRLHLGEEAPGFADLDGKLLKGYLWSRLKSY